MKSNDAKETAPTLNPKEFPVMKIVRFTTDDVLELKKNHPCGARTFTILRIGSEVRIRCTGCGRDMVIDRLKLEKSIRRVISPEPTDTEE